MHIEDLLRVKGTHVITIDPDATVTQLLDLLGKNSIGAVIVSQHGTDVAGIVSERDVVRHLAAEGPDVLFWKVAEIMTSEVHHCTLGDSIDRVATVMTQERIRHLPVLADGELSGLVSIGDVVKYRIAQLTDERNHLLDYLHS